MATALEICTAVSWRAESLRSVTWTGKWGRPARLTCNRSHAHSQYSFIGITVHYVTGERNKYKSEVTIRCRVVPQLFQTCTQKYGVIGIEGRYLEYKMGIPDVVVSVPVVEYRQNQYRRNLYLAQRQVLLVYEVIVPRVEDGCNQYRRYVYLYERRLFSEWECSLSHLINVSCSYMYPVSFS